MTVLMSKHVHWYKAMTTWFLVLRHFKTKNRCGREQFMYIVLFKTLKHSDSCGIFRRGRLFTDNYWMRHEVFNVFTPKYRWGRAGSVLFCLFIWVCKPDEGGDTEQVIKFSWPNGFFGSELCERIFWSLEIHTLTSKMWACQSWLGFRRWSSGWYRRQLWWHIA